MTSLNFDEAAKYLEEPTAKSGLNFDEAAKYLPVPKPLPAPVPYPQMGKYNSTAKPVVETAIPKFTSDKLDPNKMPLAPAFPNEQPRYKAPEQMSDIQFTMKWDANNPEPSGKDFSVIGLARHSRWKADRQRALDEYHKLYNTPNSSPVEALRTFNKVIHLDDPISTAKAIIAWDTIIKKSGRNDVYLPKEVIDRYARVNYREAMALKKYNVSLAVEAYKQTHNGQMPYDPSFGASISMIPDMIKSTVKYATGNTQGSAKGDKAYQYLKSLGLDKEVNPIAAISSPDDWAPGTIPRILPKDWQSWDHNKRQKFLKAQGVIMQEGAKSTQVKAGYQASA